MCPIFNIIPNHYNNKNMFRTIHHTFNHYKYSLFIPIVTKIMDVVDLFINIELLTTLYDNTINNSNYVYTNIVGPYHNNFTIPITDMKFLITAKNKEIVYNIMSYDNNINIICSFKKGVIKDKKRFKRAIYKAYNNMMENKEVN